MVFACDIPLAAPKKAGAGAIWASAPPKRANTHHRCVRARETRGLVSTR